MSPYYLKLQPKPILHILWTSVKALLVDHLHLKGFAQYCFKKTREHYINKKYETRFFLHLKFTYTIYQTFNCNINLGVVALHRGQDRPIITLIFMHNV